MKLSNPNPVSTWLGDLLTQQCSVECSGIFILFIYLFFFVPVFFFFFFLITLSLISMIMYSKEVWSSQ